MAITTATMICATCASELERETPEAGSRCPVCEYWADTDARLAGILRAALEG